MNIKHIYWFANFNLFSPSVRYRGKYALDFLEDKFDVSNTFIYPSYRPYMVLKFLLTIIEILFFRKENSLIVIENIYTNRVYALILKVVVVISRKATLYDIDDAEYERFSPSTIQYFMKKCEACTVGSAVLMDYAKNYNSNVLLLTSPIIQHDIVKRVRNKKMVIGWIGFFSAHKKSLYDSFFPALKQLPFAVQLHLIGVTNETDKQALINYYIDSPHVEIEFCEVVDWLDELSIYERIAKFDVGISTLLDIPLHLAKSAFKIKQCLSCGVPVLANKKGENINFVNEGENGYFCDSPNEFADMLLHIHKLTDSEYFKLSTNARNSIVHFSMEKYCQTLLDYYKMQLKAQNLLR